MIKMILSKIPVNIITGLIALFCCLSTGARGQCCPVDTLKINTGYVPMTGAVLPPITTDPKWIITYINTNMRSDIFGLGLTAACAPGVTGSAFVTGPITGFYSSSASEWINCFDSNYYYNYWGVAGDQWTASRKFSLCDTACVHFRLGIACDNDLLWMSVSNIPGDTTAPRHYFHATYDTLYNINFDTCLAAGDHYINFSIVEDAAYRNYSGLDVEGYIATATPTILPENCMPGLNVCTKPVITRYMVTPCLGDTFTLRANVTGVSWSSSNTTVATISATGFVTILAAGSTVITFMDSCGRSDTMSITVTVPAAITGTTTICVGSTTTLACATAGGTWTSSSPSVASVVLGTGVVRGVSVGISTITYTLAGGCYTIATVTVIPTPVISGPAYICKNGTGTFTSTVSGTWSSSNSAIATVNTSTGVVYGTYSGTGSATVTITCTSAAGCAGTAIVTVYQIPNLAVTPTTATVYCGTAISMTSSIAFTPSSTSYSYVFSPTTGVFPSSGTITSGTGYPFTASVTPPASTSYVITVTDGHGCVNSMTRRVVVPCGDFCALAGGSGVTLLNSASGNIPISSYGSGGAPTYYYVDNPNISGAPFTSNFTGGGTSASFIGAVVAVAANVAINIPAGKDVYISSSHFFCCEKDTTWLGFRLGSTPTDTNGRIKFTQNSLIEDAEIAVASSNASISTAYTAASNPIISANGVIFNRNKIGIQIQNYTPATTGYPFVVDNSIFTSRNLDSFYRSGLVYPSAWPTLAELRDYFNPGTIVRPPLNIDNPTAKPTVSSPTNYARIGCKSTGAVIDARLGIYLVNVGTTTGGTYYGFEMASDGTPPTVSTPGSFNLFDNLNYGVMANPANLTVKGAWFSHLKPKTMTSTEGIGVYTTGASAGTNYRLQVNPSTTDTLQHRNYFYNCRTGVNSSGYHRLNCSYNRLFSDHIASSPDSTIGNTGYDILASGATGISLNVTMKGNYMVNIDNGIKYNTSGEAFNGLVTMNFNQIVGTVPSWTTGYSTRAIYAQNGTPAAGAAVSCILAIRNNLIYDVYNGIKIFNFSRWSVRTDTNKVSLKGQSGATAQYGINHTNCKNARAVHNYVVGDSSTTGVESGIFGSNNINDTIRCNVVDSTLKGFEFTGPTNTTFWHHNEMRKHRYGLHLTGIFGPQGDSTHPCDNIWGRSCSSLGSGIYHTYNNNLSTTSLAASKLYTRDNTSTPEVFNPWANLGISFAYYGGAYGSPCSGLGTYDGTTLIRVVSPPTYAPCSPTDTIFPRGSLYARFAEGGDTVIAGDGGDGEQRSAAGSLNIAAGRKWINQMAAWEILIDDSTVADSIPTLHAFKAMAANSRYKWLTDIGNYFADGNYSAAQSLLSQDINSLSNTSVDDATGITMWDGSAANYVVQNYIDVYRYSIKYATDVLSDEDVADILDIANLCPNNDGKIVFAARSLYYNITGKVLEPGDNCSGNEGATTRNGHQNNNPIKNINELSSGQSYSIRPNPNNGNLTIEQKVTDNTFVKVQVLNVMGKLVYSSNSAFSNGKLNISLLDAIPGLYLLQLSDNSGNVFIRKFVIQ